MVRGVRCAVSAWALLAACHAAPVAGPPVTTTPVTPAPSAPSALLVDAGYRLPVPVRPAPVAEVCVRTPASPEAPWAPAHRLISFTSFVLVPVRRGPWIAERPRPGRDRTVEELARPVVRRASDVTACWKWAAARGALDTDLTVELTIEPLGRTRDVSVRSSVAGQDDLVACVHDVLAPAQWIRSLHDRPTRVTSTLELRRAPQPPWPAPPARPVPPPPEPVFPTGGGTLCAPVSPDAAPERRRIPYVFTVSDDDDRRETPPRVPRVGGLYCDRGADAIEKAAVRLAVRSNLGALQACHAEAVLRTPGLVGDVRAAMTIDVRGQVGAVRVSGAGDLALHACLAAALDAVWVDPVRRGAATADVELTLTLAPAPAPASPDDPAALLASGDAEGALAAWAARLRVPHAPLAGCLARAGIVQAMAEVAPWLDDARMDQVVRSLVRAAGALPPAEGRACLTGVTLLLERYANVYRQGPVVAQPLARQLERGEVVLPLAPLLAEDSILPFVVAERLAVVGRPAEAAALIADRARVQAPQLAAWRAAVEEPRVLHAACWLP